MKMTNMLQAETAENQLPVNGLKRMAGSRGNKGFDKILTAIEKKG